MVSLKSGDFSRCHWGAYKTLYLSVGSVVCQLPRGMLAEEGRGPGYNTTLAIQKRELGATDHVNGDTCGVGESSTESRSSKFMGTSPNNLPSMRIKQILLSFCQAT